MCAFLQTPQPRANSSPVGGWTTWSGHSVPSSCLPLGPIENLRMREKKEKNRLMLEDYVNTHYISSKKPQTKWRWYIFLKCWIGIWRGKNWSNCHVIETVKFKLKMARCL